MVGKPLLCAACADGWAKTVIVPTRTSVRAIAREIRRNQLFLNDIANPFMHSIQNTCREIGYHHENCAKSCWISLAASHYTTIEMTRERSIEISFRQTQDE